MAKQKTVQTSLPNWQLKDLQNLAQQGQLSGVQPQVLAGVETAEYNPAYPPSVNSSDFGGYFGLGGPSSSAPSGMSDAALQTPATYSQQAVIAAQDYSSDLQSTGGTSNYAAEQQYQGGGTQGVGVFQKLGIPDNPGGSYPSMTGIPSSTTPSQQAVLTSTGSGSSSLSVNLNNPLPTWGPSWLPWNWASDAGNAIIDTLIPWALIIVGVILVGWGLLKTFGSTDKITLQQAPQQAPSAKQTAEKDTTKAAETAAVVAA